MLTMPSGTPWGNTNFSFVYVYPLEIASWFKMGTHIYFPNLMQEPCLVWTYAGFMQAATVSVSAYVSVIL